MLSCATAGMWCSLVLCWSSAAALCLHSNSLPLTVSNSRSRRYESGFAAQRHLRLVQWHLITPSGQPYFHSARRSQRMCPMC
ncbi:hypothetical protein BDZ90DRAFT_234427 [Jaminaea rosea]|uniref:Secreted protein n=1 Tax=Jaminaea rosea TaxID=1569628 RepID=A0A316UIU7_9BASI|nr:hypothetical protein BDZ90DRAFT_234427 [Jaminaea rosea]PWN25227.1 hypothetical protein BDZ90DRAFT_234427 [Jaminaea rosea]